MSIEDVRADERYLKLLAEKFPNISAVATEIVNLEAILSLPKSTEHFLSDLHGESGAFIHMLKNASGVIRRKVDDIYGDTLSEAEKRALCAMIYYPDERLEYYHSLPDINLEEIYRTQLHQVIAVARAVTVKYTRSKVRKLLPKDFAYVIEELLHESTSEPNRQSYYNAIIEAIINTGRAEDLLIAISYLIHSLAIDSLHIVGDIYDRGPRAYKIMEILCTYHDFDIQWGNHDIEWMGAAAGNLALIASVLRVSIRYANVETLEEDYSINLLPLANFAMHTYGDDPCTVFQTKDFENNPRLTRSADLMAKMHKAISIIQFKLEGQIIQRHPEYEMNDRLLLHLIDKERGTITIAGKEYALSDSNLPTLDPQNPYALSAEEQSLIDQLAHSFQRSEKLQKHLRCLYNHGSLYLVRNNCLLYHAAIPLNADGTFQEVTINGQRLKGKALMTAIDTEIRKAYYAPQGSCVQTNALDYMWYLWCGPCSPLYNKDKMTTFERYFIDDKQLAKEAKGAYYELANTYETCCNILREFGLDPAEAHIINGHIPVRTLEGESPLRANGLRLVIDGGFSKPYQKQTGIAGYTLIYNSHGMQLIEHEKFESRAQAVLSGADIHSRVQLVDKSEHRMLVRDTDRGKELVEQVNNLHKLLFAYQHGLIKEKL
ncbi:MAG: fructose-1,6-bisphosphatase [Paludibacteraceae bacterium]|nr:fructose-1,6-bisphosphatase [Bacteroidales bacterium]MDY4849892.1 fructose-1,6-bisphosphatase [Paludibacteraceae bacterium]MCI7430726.1 fructose-1,6-bisphosphatase [Bacteroidales bacterium]MDD6641208.1 fructose-1,6-bisphosphatase [Bacteroidales bacterium]MDD6781727.1 fructose-1,6-bisphosphatase [Bacteroidales bacterium]